MRAALGLLLLCVAAGARADPIALQALEKVCEIEEFLSATYWNRTLAAQGATPEQIDDFHAMRTLMKAGRCVYADKARAIEDEDRAVRVCIDEKEKRLRDDFRDAISSNGDALAQLKAFNAHAESLKPKESEEEAGKRMQGSIAALGHATANHDDAMREFQDSQAELNAKLESYVDRLIQAVFPPAEFTADFKEWHEGAGRRIEAAVQEAKVAMETADAAVAELKTAIASRTPRAVNDQ